jgi:two-component system response regulator TtrR
MSDSTMPTLPAHSVVYVVDDDEAVRDSLRWLLEANGFTAVAYDSAEVLPAHSRRRRHARPGSLPDPGCPHAGMSGLELHEELLRRDINLPLIFITGHGDVPMAVSSMKRGAVDFLEKPFNDAHLCSIVRSCLARSAAQQRDSEAERQAQERLERLTQRERQVLVLIVAGRLNKQIADDLSISIKTVEAHRANIMDKLAARTMADLMKTALLAENAVRAGDTGR